MEGENRLEQNIIIVVIYHLNILIILYIEPKYLPQLTGKFSPIAN